MVVNFCLNTWQRNVEIVTFLKWCLSVFTNTTCVLLGGLTKKYSEAIHCLIVDTYTAGSEEHFCKEKVWLTPSSNKVFMVSSTPSLGRTTCLTHRCRPLRPYLLLCTVFQSIARWSQSIQFTLSFNMIIFSLSISKKSLPPFHTNTYSF